MKPYLPMIFENAEAKVILENLIQDMKKNDLIKFLHKHDIGYKKGPMKGQRIHQNTLKNKKWLRNLILHHFFEA